MLHPRLSRCQRHRETAWQRWILQAPDSPAPSVHGWLCAALEAGYQPDRDAWPMLSLVEEARRLVGC